MQWRQCSIAEAFTFASGKTIAKDAETGHPPESLAEVVGFTDGTAVACLSQWRYYGEESGDEADQVAWWIGEKEAPASQNREAEQPCDRSGPFG